MIDWHAVSDMLPPNESTCFVLCWISAKYVEEHTYLGYPAIIYCGAMVHLYPDEFTHWAYISDPTTYLVPPHVAGVPLEMAMCDEDMGPIA